MSDTELCRKTAACYAIIAEGSGSPDVQIGYRKLESLWLEMARWTRKLDFDNHEDIRQRIYALAEQSGEILRSLQTRH